MKRFIGLLLALLWALPVGAQATSSLTLVTHDSFAISEDVLANFTAQTGIQVEVLRLGDAGLLVNQSILSKRNPLGDVLYGVDNTFLGRALAEDLFIPYQSPMLDAVPDEFVVDSEYRVTPINYGDVCLNYDVAYFEANALPIPQTLRDLTDPMYRGLLVVENAATSSPGLAFLLTTVAVFGETGDYTYLNFWADLIANDVVIAQDWTDAYYGQFSGASGSDGTRPLVVSYASSPPAEVYFAAEPLAAAPTAAITAPGTCFRQVEFAGILVGTEKVEAAQQWIDYMLSVEFQEDVPLQMFVFPVNPEAQLPPVFVEHAAVPDDPVRMTGEQIDEGRSRWVQGWVETVQR